VPRAARAGCGPTYGSRDVTRKMCGRCVNGRGNVVVRHQSPGDYVTVTQQVQGNAIFCGNGVLHRTCNRGRYPVWQCRWCTTVIGSGRGTNRYRQNARRNAESRNPMYRW